MTTSADHGRRLGDTVTPHGSSPRHVAPLGSNWRTATVLVALVLLALSVTPRLGKPAAGKARYFQELGQFPNAATMLEVVAEDAADPVVRHSQQLYTQSLIARRKYEHLRNSMYAVAVGLLMLGIAAVVSAFD